MSQKDAQKSTDTEKDTQQEIEKIRELLFPDGQAADRQSVIRTIRDFEIRTANAEQKAARAVSCVESLTERVGRLTDRVEALESRSRDQDEQLDALRQAQTGVIGRLTGRLANRLASRSTARAEPR